MTEQRVQSRKYVQFTYTITSAKGNILEQVDLPVGYVHGADSGILEKVEQALEGSSVGDTITVAVSPDEGFGPHRPELTYTDDLNNVPEQFRYIGAEVEMQSDRGEVKTFHVSKIENGKLTVDGNHPLAGKDLTFTVKITAIRDATSEDLASSAGYLNTAGLRTN